MLSIHPPGQDNEMRPLDARDLRDKAGRTEIRKERVEAHANLLPRKLRRIEGMSGARFGASIDAIIMHTRHYGEGTRCEPR